MVAFAAMGKRVCEDLQGSVIFSRRYQLNFMILRISVVGV
jgi:hypothetical protein